MLVLTRKTNETIIVGDDMEITIIEVRGEQVKLGIKAPKGIKIFRGEIYTAIREEMQYASKSAGLLDKSASLDDIMKKKN